MDFNSCLKQGDNNDKKLSEDSLKIEKELSYTSGCKFQNKSIILTRLRHSTTQHTAKSNVVSKMQLNI